MVRSVNLAGFPEVVAPKAINGKRGDIKQDSAGDGSSSRLGGLLVGVRMLAQRAEENSQGPLNLQEGRQKAGSDGEFREN